MTNKVAIELPAREVAQGRQGEDDTWERCVQAAGGGSHCCCPAGSLLSLTLSINPALISENQGIV